MNDAPQVRPDRPAAGPVAHFRLDQELGRLREEPAWRSGSRNAITLTKEPGPGLRVVLSALRTGARLHEHQAPGPLTVHVLSGRIRFHADGRPTEMGPGELAVLDPGVRHAVEALEESAVLLTLGLPVA